jgi:hypothetical protein
MTTEQRDAKCVPIAEKVLDLIAKNKMKELLETDIEKRAKDCYEVQKQILELYLKEEMTMGEIFYVKNLVLSLIDTPLTFVNESLSTSWDNTIVKLFGKEEKEITLKEIQDILTK